MVTTAARRCNGDWAVQADRGDNGPYRPDTGDIEEDERIFARAEHKGTGLHSSTRL